MKTHQPFVSLPVRVMALPALILALTALICSGTASRAYADDAVREGVPYRIVSAANPDVVIDLAAAHPHGGTGAAMAAPDEDASQVFTFVKAPDGSDTYYIRSYYNPSLLLTATGLAYRAGVTADFAAADKAQAWTLQEQSDGTYFLIAGTSGWIVDVAGDSVRAGSACIMWQYNGGQTQRWTFQPVEADAITGRPNLPISAGGRLDGAAYQLVSVSNPGVVLQLADDPVSSVAVNVAEPVEPATAKEAAHQVFFFDMQPDGSYLIRSKTNSSLLLTSNANTARGSVAAWEVGAPRPQSWVLDVCDDGSLHILSQQNPTWMLDTNGSDTQAGAECIMWFDNGGATQKWTLRTVQLGSAPGATQSGDAAVTEEGPVALAGSAVKLSAKASIVEAPAAPAEEPAVAEESVEEPAVGEEPVAVEEPAEVADPAAEAEEPAATAEVVEAIEPAETTEPAEPVATPEDQTAEPVAESVAEPVVEPAEPAAEAAEPAAAADPAAAVEEPATVDVLGDDNITSGAYYRIVNVDNPQVVLQLSGSRPGGGSAATLAAPSADMPANQVFCLVSAGNGKYWVRSAFNPGLLLTARSLSFRGGVVGDWSNGSALQTWNFQLEQDGTYLLIPDDSEWVIDITGDAARPGSSCIMWQYNGGKTQRWTLQQVDADLITGAADMPGWSPSGTRDGAYSLVNAANPGTVVQVGNGSTDSTAVTVATPADTDVDAAAAQRFYFELQPDGSFLVHSAVNPDMLLTASGLTHRAPVTGAALGEANQSWVIEPLGDGAFRLRSAANPAWLLDVSGSEVVPGAACIMWDANNSATQRWVFSAAE